MNTEVISLRNRAARKDRQMYIAFDLLTSWLVERTDNGDGFEDADPEIDNIRSILEDAIEI